MREEWRKIIKVHPVTLFKKDLIELIEMLTKCDSGYRCDLSLHFEYEDIKHTLNSVEEVRAFSKNTPTDELSIEVITWDKNRNIINGVSLNMYHSFIQYLIHSDNEEWFLGRIAQLTKFFRKRKPWYSLLSRTIPIWGPLLALSTFSFAVAALRAAKYFTFASSLISGIVLVVILALAFKEKIFPYVRIYPYDNDTRRKIFTYEVVSIMIALLTLLVTIFASILLPILSKQGQ